MRRVLYFVLRPLVREKYYATPVAGYVSWLELPLVGTIGFRQDDDRLDFSW
jgi:hypothetical protein